jgi:predicted HicB family RNase H-like nuclease
MKIGEILEELKRGKKLVDIGKELVVGKEKLSKALKNAGYKFSRKDGWVFQGKGAEPLNRDYTDFTEPRKNVRKANTEISAIDEVSATIEAHRLNDAPTSQLSDKTTSKEIGKLVSLKTNKETNKQINKQVGFPTLKPDNQQSNNPTNKEKIKPVVKPSSKEAGKQSMKKVTYEIEEWLHDELKIQAIRQKRTVSEIVNEIIKESMK